MDIILEIHSILRWAIVVVGIVAVVKFVLGWLRKSEFEKMDANISKSFSRLMDAQGGLGLLVLLITGLGSVGFPRERLEHSFTMLLAIAASHAPAMFKNKGWNKFGVALGAVVVALLLVYVGVMRLPGGWSR